MEHPFSNHVLSPDFTEQMSLKKNGYFPLSSQGLLPLETSEQSLLRVKPSSELAHTYFSNTATLLVTVIQNRSHRDRREAAGNARDSALPTDATLDHLLTAANAATLTCTAAVSAKSEVER